MGTFLVDRLSHLPCRTRIDQTYLVTVLNGFDAFGQTFVVECEQVQLLLKLITLCE